MNILDKSDKSKRDVFGSQSKVVSKRERYDWKVPGKMGTFKLIDKTQLNIDGRYQREQVSEAKVFNIARNWDWRAFSVLDVIERPDGSYWVMDGGHRTRASFKRDDITKLPCMVFKESELAEEAKTFLVRNTMISGVNSITKHVAGVVAEEPMARQVEAILSKYGYRAVRGGNSKWTFSAVAALRKIVKSDPELADEVFGFCVSIAIDGEQFSGDVLKAIAICRKKLAHVTNILAGDPAKALRDTGIDGISAAIRREEVIVGKGGEFIAARAILNIINRNRRRKLHFE